MAINWQEHSVVDYALANGLKSDLKQILRNEGWVEDGDESFNGFKFDVIDEFGGEGKGEIAWYVYNITYPDGHNEYWRANLSYYSYDGVQWEYWDVSNLERVVVKEVVRKEWVAE
jgi:hypothetical protein